ncbi:uncharacterized protein LOC131146676 isoform X2 [Malania oleifera]|uniref:uncharacterized protein LOC131146676 isoform X2 n=1 Tax=Malania oleifera TaxID=397392 RepID=UPI0025AE5FA2|nr:uncharacterized protein LOC131146676 isoform X2 [Malania oleifera]
MAADVMVKVEQLNPCCALLKGKYMKLEEKRNALRQAVKLLEQEINKVQAENLNLRKAYEEVRAQADIVREEKVKESDVRVTLENEVFSLKSEVSLLQQKGCLGAQGLHEEIKLLQERVSEAETEINRLNDLLEKEKLRAVTEKNKAAEAWGIVKAEKSRADEAEKRFADIEGRKAEEYRIQLETARKEADQAKSKMILETVKTQEENINRLKELLEKEKLKADMEKKKAAAETNRAAEAWKIVKAEKSRADEERRRANIEGKNAEKHRIHLEAIKKEADEARSKLVLEAVEERKRADIEGKKAEEYRIQLETVKKEDAEARSKLDLVMANFEEANKMLKVEKQKAMKLKEHEDSERLKTKELKKLAEANRKNAMAERSRADCLSQQLKEDKLLIEELRKEKHQLISSLELAETAPDGFGPETMSRESDGRQLVLEFLKQEDTNKMTEVVKEKAYTVKKCAGLEIVELEEQRKLVEVYRKMAMEEKHCADQLSQQLEADRCTIEKLKKEKHELESSKSFTRRPAMKAESERMKLLKKQLKFEKMQVKHAIKMAKLEKGRSSMLHQEVCRLKQEFVQFSHRLDVLDSCSSCCTEGIDDIAKTSSFSYMQILDMKRKVMGVEAFQNTSDCLKQVVDCTAPLLQESERKFVESVSGIDSKLGPLLGGSQRKMLQSSALNSSKASFSDRQLVGSQEKGAFSVMTSAKLMEENSNPQPFITKLPGNVNRMNYNENSAVVAENSVRSPLCTNVVGRVSGRSSKRKRILDAVESIECMNSKGKKLHLQIEERLHVLHDMLNRQMDKSLEVERYLTSTLQEDSCVKHDGSRKKRAFHREEGGMQHLCDMDEQQKRKKLGTNTSGEANLQTQAPFRADTRTEYVQVCKDEISDFVRGNQERVDSFEEVADGNYMKLLELDNAIDEECYQAALKMPLSPSLPEISEVLLMDDSECLVEERFHEIITNGKDNLVSSQSFEVINVEINSNESKLSHPEAFHEPMLQESIDYVDSCGKAEHIENAFSSGCVGKASAQQVFITDMELHASNMLRPVHEGEKFPCESENKSCGSIPNFCVVFSDTKKISSISRIFCATRNCMARCCLASQMDWAVPEILRALLLEDDLLPGEKACVFFSLLLHHFSGTALRFIGNFLAGLSKLCLDSFAAHISAVMSDVETRRIFADLCDLDELFSLIEEFLVNGKVLVYNDESAESLLECDSRIDIFLDGVNINLSEETAVTCQLVGGSIILASICVALDQIGFICEASYNIFRMHRFDSSLSLTILHVFAHLCGEQYLTLHNYSLTMAVVKSMVIYLEREKPPGAACLPSPSEALTEFPPCARCPFSEGAVSVDIVISLLLEKLQSCALSGTMHQHMLETIDLLNSSIPSNHTKDQQSSESAFDMTLYQFSDIISLVELIAYKMTWRWTCDKIVPQLLKIFESCVQEKFAAAIVILLGQLGKLGLDDSGHEDMGIRNLRSRFSALLACYSPGISNFSLQVAVVYALLGILSFDFEELLQSNAEVRAFAGESGPADLIKNWFYSLGSEQQSVCVGFLKSDGVLKNRGT